MLEPRVSRSVITYGKIIILMIIQLILKLDRDYSNNLEII